MRSVFSRAFLGFLLIALAALGSCTGELSTSLEGKQCDPVRGCLPGYVCAKSLNLCVRACGEGQTLCGSGCVTLADDEGNCGGCAAACTAPANGIAICDAGECRFDCEDGYEACGDRCVATSSDLDHCGGCGRACRTPSPGTPRCEDGSCVVDCEPPFELCDGVCLDTRSDPARCGGCRVACAPGEACDAGRCSDECS